MVGRFTLRDDRTLFLFVFAADGDSLPSTLDQQKDMLRENMPQADGNARSILAELDRATELYFDRVSQIRMRSWSKGASPSSGMPLSAYRCWPDRVRHWR